MQVVIIVGNPKPRSRTYEAAQLVAKKLTGQAPQQCIDLVDFGAALLDWADPEVAEAVAAVQAADHAVLASPTFKATYTRLLKLFLDRIAGGALVGLTAVPMMLGGHRRHSLAADLLLKPVLVDLGATCPTRGLFRLDTEYAESETLDDWLEVARPQVLAATRAR